MKSPGRKNSHRVERMNDLFKETIARYLISGLRYGADSESLSFVSVTRARVTGDLQLARIYITAMDVDAEKPQEKKAHANRVVSSLKERAGEIRHHLAHELNLRRTPELEFYYDYELEESYKLEKIFYEIEQKKKLQSE